MAACRQIEVRLEVSAIRWPRRAASRVPGDTKAICNFVPLSSQFLGKNFLSSRKKRKDPTKILRRYDISESSWKMDRGDDKQCSRVRVHEHVKGSMQINEGDARNAISSNGY